MKIANNTTAAAYNRLQRHVDWVEGSPDARLETLLVMKQLLIQAPSHTPIFDFECANFDTGLPSVRTAAEQLATINRRIMRTEQEAQQ